MLNDKRAALHSVHGRLTTLPDVHALLVVAGRLPHEACRGTCKRSAGFIDQGRSSTGVSYSSTHARGVAGSKPEEILHFVRIIT